MLLQLRPPVLHPITSTHTLTGLGPVLMPWEILVILVHSPCSITQEGLAKDVACPWDSRYRFLLFVLASDMSHRSLKCLALPDAVCVETPLFGSSTNVPAMQRPINARVVA